MTKITEVSVNEKSVVINRPSTPSLLIVEDDGPLMQSLVRSMEVRGFEVVTARSVTEGLAKVELNAPDYAVVDMRLEDGCGLEVIHALKERRAESRAIILTGYGNIATAVKAVKLGATNYLAKPADADEVVATLMAPDGSTIEPPQHPMSATLARWEHIRAIHEQFGCNVSETARRLNMHRRTLQRILAKYAPR